MVLKKMKSVRYCATAHTRMITPETPEMITPEMMKLPQATWIETFLEGVVDLSTGAFKPGCGLASAGAGSQALSLLSSYT